MHELVEVEVYPACENVEFFQGQKEVEGLALIRCPSCQGLRGISKRNRKTRALCGDCRSGNVVPRTSFCGYWLELFSEEEIEQMATAIWGATDSVAK